MHSFQDILIKKCIYYPSGSVVKNLPDNAGDEIDVGSILAWEDPLE